MVFEYAGPMFIFICALEVAIGSLLFVILYNLTKVISFLSLTQGRKMCFQEVERITCEAEESGESDDVIIWTPRIGRPKKNDVREKKQDYQNECERVEVERRFSLAKRKCGMGLIVTKLEETISYSIAMSVVVLNLWKIQHASLYFLFHWLSSRGFTRNIAFVQ